MKNRADERDENAHWALDWMGQLPGKRENRRYLGDHVLTQNDVRDGGRFDDLVAHGGWPMDDHHPAGLYYPGAPTVFHAAPSPYGIPYRSLYSCNIENLMCAGRNISVTHAALSSTRVMGTCSVLGQAAGTAAALAIRLGVKPSTLYPDHIPALQQMLMDDDQWLPGFSRTTDRLASSAMVTGQDAKAVLLNGHDRPVGDELNGHALPLGQPITWTWDQPEKVGGLRLVFDSNLNNQKKMPAAYARRGNRSAVPTTLARSVRIEALDASGQWRTAFRDDSNHQRLRRVPLQLETQGIRLVVESTHGAEASVLFGAEPVHRLEVADAPQVRGERFRDLRSAMSLSDLRPPDSAALAAGRERSTGGA